MTDAYSRSQLSRLVTIFHTPERDTVFTEFQSQRHLLVGALQFPAHPALYSRSELADLPGYGVGHSDLTILADAMTDNIFAAANYNDAVAKAMLELNGVEDGYQEYATGSTESDKEAIAIAEQWHRPRKDLPPIEIEELDESIRIIEGAFATAKMIMNGPSEEYEAIPMTHEMWQSPYDPKTI